MIQSTKSSGLFSEWCANNFEMITKIVFTLATSVLLPAVETILFAGFMIFVDTVTGVLAAMARKEKVSSTKLKRVLSKLIVYPLAIIVASWAEYILPAIPFVKSAAMLLIVIEGGSVIENINDIIGYNIVKVLKILITEGKEAVIKFKLDEIEKKRNKKQESETP